MIELAERGSADNTAVAPNQFTTMRWSRMANAKSNKLCECGCGEFTSTYPQTYTSLGIKKGDASRFVAGHNARRDPDKPGAYKQRYDPNSSTYVNGNIFEHRLIASRALGRPLPSRHPVHHVDENRLNNENKNLVICESHSYHRLLHVRANIVRHGGNPNSDHFCTLCRVCKPKSEFNIMRSVASGLQSGCRECGKKWRKVRTEKDRLIREGAR